MAQDARLLHLPSEVVAHIIHFLRWQDVIHLGAASRVLLRQLRGRQRLWQQMYHEALLQTDQHQALDTFMLQRLMEETKATADPAAPPPSYDKIERNWELRFHRRYQLANNWRTGRARRVPIPPLLPPPAEATVQTGPPPQVIASCAAYTVVFQPPHAEDTASGQLFLIRNMLDADQRCQLLRLMPSVPLRTWPRFPTTPRLLADEQIVTLVVQSIRPQRFYLCVWSVHTGQLILTAPLHGATSATLVDRRGRWLLLGLNEGRWCIYDIGRDTHSQPVMPITLNAGLECRFGRSYGSTAHYVSSLMGCNVTVPTQDSDEQPAVEVLHVAPVVDRPNAIYWHAIRCQSSAQSANGNRDGIISLSSAVQVLQRFVWQAIAGADHHYDRLAVSVTGLHGEASLVVVSRAQGVVLWMVPTREPLSQPTVYLSDIDMLVVAGWVEHITRSSNGRMCARTRSFGFLCLNAMTGAKQSTFTAPAVNCRAATLDMPGLFLVYSPVSRDKTGMAYLVDARTGTAIRTLDVTSVPGMACQSVGPTHHLTLDSKDGQLYLYDYAAHDMTG